MNIWLYHINPNNRYGYTMGWNLERPRTLLRRSDRTWGAGSMFNKVRPRDMICVFMKNIPKNPDGVYVVGNIQDVGLKGGTSFSWAVDREKSAKIVVSPILTDMIRKCFPRIYGGSMQPLAERHRKTWISLLGRENKVFNDAPIIPVRKSPRRKQLRQTVGDPLVSRENGMKGERYILALLRREFSPNDGYRVEHVAARDPSADHDIAVSKGRTVIQIVEVKTRVGKPSDPVIISDRELGCRKRHRAKHVIFIVYLDKSGNVHSTLRIGRTDAFQLLPRQHWLHPDPV